MGQQCCNVKAVREEKRIYISLLSLYKNNEFKQLTITKFSLITETLMKKSSKDLKILVKKNDVRKNFIRDLDQTLQKEKDMNKSLFFMNVLTNLAKFLIDEYQSNDIKNNITLDIEQEIYKITGRIISKYPETVVAYYSSCLYSQVMLVTSKLDSYINIEKYLNRLKECLDEIKDMNENLLFKEKTIEIITFLFKKSNFDQNQSIRDFILEVIFTEISENVNEVKIHKENLTTLIKTSTNTMSKKAYEEIEDNYAKRFFLNLKCFHSYLLKYTPDINSGKKIWKYVEELIKKKIKNDEELQSLIEILILNIFTINSESNETSEVSKKLIFSTVFEYLCDGLNINSRNVNESKRVKLTLFNEILFNYSEILVDDVINERYMQYFARIIIEECYAELDNHSNENENILLLKLNEIVSKYKEPFKLYISILNNTSKIFNQLKEAIIVENSDEKDLLFIKIYQKVNTLLTKYSLFTLVEKCNIEKDEALMIISNFSTKKPVLRPFYIKFFINFFIFIDANFKIEYEFKHRKNLILEILEMIYELIFLLADDQIEKEKLLYEEAIKLFEILALFARSYSFDKLEDGYLIYKSVGLMIKKIIKNLEIIPENILYLVIFLTFLMNNLLRNFHDLSGFILTLTSSINEFMQKITTREINENLNLLLLLSEKWSLHDTYKKLQRNILSFSGKKDRKPDQLKQTTLTNSQSQECVECLYSIFFSRTSNLNTNFEHLLNSKGFQIFVKEFNQEMTFRDLNRLSKESDNLSEYSFVMSNRDFDRFANESVRLSLDIKKSGVALDHKNQSNINASNDERDNDINEINIEFNNRKRDDDFLGFDDFFKGTDVNQIKI